MARLMTRDKPWIMIDGHSAGVNGNAQEARIHVREAVLAGNSFVTFNHFLALKTEVPIQFMSVCGIDSLSNIKSKNGFREGLVCVVNRKTEEDAQVTHASHPHKVIYAYLR
jgi:hypothetical protein